MAVFAIPSLTRLSWAPRDHGVAPIIERRHAIPLVVGPVSVHQLEAVLLRVERHPLPFMPEIQSQLLAGFLESFSETAMRVKQWVVPRRSPPF